MGRRPAIIASLIFLSAIAILAWLKLRSHGEPSQPPSSEAITPTPAQTQSATSPSSFSEVSPSVTGGSPEIPLQVPMDAPLPSSERRDVGNPLAPASIPEETAPRPAEEDPRMAAEMEKIASMIRDYRTIAGENPVGTNAEIMKAMMGDNPRNAKLGPPEGMSLNAVGELLDHWGTPVFFHQISRDVMEIHSAGPDGRLGTEDDLVLK